VSDYQLGRVAGLFLQCTALGIAWAALTIAVGALMIPASGDDWRRTLTRHALGFLICGLADTLVRRVVSMILGGSPVLPWYGTLLYFADHTAVAYLAVVLVTRALTANDRFIVRQQGALSLRAELARARLASLEGQLHPHFLFNTLGAVTELAHEAPAAAARMLRQLASVIRFAVNRQGSEVTLGEELAALDDYLDVQRTRFSDWLTIETRIEPGARDLLMPPLVLQPLVENALRHGLVRRDMPGAIVVTGAERDGQLVLEVRDNGVGLRGGQLSGRGIGTMNLRDRLATLYGDDARLTLFEDTAGGVISHVSLPAHRQLAAEVTAAPHEEESFVAMAFRRWPAVTVITGWAVWGLLYTQQSIAYLAFRNRLGGRSVTGIAAQDFLTSMIWAALTPLMLMMARVVPFARRRLGLRIAAHVTAAVAIAGIQFLVTRQLFAAGAALEASEAIGAISWGVLAYAVVLSAAHYKRIQEWLQERDLAEARMRADLAEAQLEASWSRAQPRALLDRLEAIAQFTQRDAAEAERMLARLGDELRASLDTKVPA
jgi:two-component system, LytTR family, sensor kinase